MNADIRDTMEYMVNGGDELIDKRRLVLINMFGYLSKVTV